MKHALILLVLLAVAAACGSGGEGGRTTSTGPTAPSASASPAGRSSKELARVQTAFCHDYLPLLAFTIDVGIVTGGDAIGTKNEDEVLALVEKSSTVLRQMETQMTIYADSLADLGEEDASNVATQTASLAEEIVRAPDGQTIAVAIDPASLDAVLPSDYCPPFISAEFGRGYFDGWLLEPKDSDDPEYVRGYRLGRAEGWRADP